VHVNALIRATKQHETDWCRYREVTQSDGGLGMYDGNIDAADALITRTPGLALFLPVADCIGAAIYDLAQNIIMVSHLGRHSLEQHGAQKSVEYLVRTHGSIPSNLQIWLTPAAGKDTFPIWALNNQGLKESAYMQFHAAGITDAQIIDNPIDTTRDSRYYSYSEFLKGNRDIDADYAIVAMIIA
jgi:copper oxidase (laccase) domain-containing protein